MDMPSGNVNLCCFIFIINFFFIWHTKIISASVILSSQKFYEYNRCPSVRMPI